MVKNLTYRDKLIELAKIYKITEVQNYIKNKKYLTTSQIEHILKKNKVPIPTEINKSLIEIQAKKIVRPFNEVGNKVAGYYDDTSKGIGNFFIGIFKGLFDLFLKFLNSFPKIGGFFGKLLVDFFNSIYSAKVQENKLNKFVSTGGVIIIILAIGLVGLTVFNNFGKDLTVNVIKSQEKEIKETKKNIDLKKEETQKNNDKKELASVPKKQEKKIEKQPNEVTELILPNLNLKTETVLSLFEDVQYDLKDVRFKKRVKPIYFTQFPKDLDEIKSSKLKKETFIKIVLPLVVAENDKILDDRVKLKRIKSKKKLTEKDQAWIRQKNREYKIGKTDLIELEKRMDIIPVSIALAQAAKESGWGTSRFALEGNAIFGQWTWTGRGIAPLEREKSQSHKILRFPILRASVKAYKNNLNTHTGYNEFRDKRFNFRKRNKSVKGLDLIDTLDKYAQTGKEYTKILEKIIEQNNLADFETVQLTNSVVKKELNL